MLLANTMTPEFLKGLAFEPRVGESWSGGYGQSYWRGDSLSFTMRPKPDQSENIAYLFGHDPAHVKLGFSFAPLWWISFTDETPAELVTAMIRRASDYVDVVMEVR
jgi:hypothetical protein